MPSLIVLELDSEDATRSRAVDVATGRLGAGVAAVLEVSAPLGEAAGDTFFITLYGEIAKGTQIDIALNHGRRQLARLSDSPSFAIPARYMNHPGPLVHAADAIEREVPKVRVPLVDDEAIASSIHRAAAPLARRVAGVAFDRSARGGGRDTRGGRDGRAARGRRCPVHP